MAFPVVESTATTGRTAAETTSPVTFPATISANALIVCIARAAVAGAIGWPVDWVELVEDSSDASDDVTAIAYFTAVGNEDGTTFNVTHGSGKSAYIVYSITGAEAPATQAPQISAVAIGTSTLPDPASLTPTGGAKDYLWIWLGGWEGEQTSPPAGAPTNYTAPGGASTGTGGVVATNCRVASARRALNAASEDPPLWTISVSDDWAAWTMAVHPASVQTFPQTLTTTAVGSAATRQLQANKIVTASIVTSLATLTKEMTKALTATAVNATATMSQGLTFVRTLTANLVASATTMLRALTFGRTLTTTAVISTATRQLQANKGLTITVVTSAASMVKTANKALSTTLVSSTASLVKSINRSLTTVVVASATTMIRSLSLGRTLTAAVVTSAATMSRGLSFGRTLSAISTVVARLTRHRSFGLPFLYTAANWDAATSFYLEVYMRASLGTVRARLYNDTDAAPVANSEVTTTSTIYVRLRSILVALTDGKTYSVQFGSEGSDAGAFRGARLIAV